MYNYGKLLLEISNYGWGDFFTKTNFNKEHFFKIVINYEQFVITDIQKMCEVLNIDSPVKVKELFFTQTVEKKQL